ncbi:MAG: hypothetical protein ISR91_03710 [Candidatus Delongbacteria bacterium]|nr:hypothetical protein [Candidatus Delongbacteria bacterium]
MPQDLNKLLEESRDKIQDLVAEIKQYRSSRELNQKATEALEKVTESLGNTIQKLEPYNDHRMRQYQGLVKNLLFGITGLLVVVIVMLVLRW